MTTPKTPKASSEAKAPEEVKENPTPKRRGRPRREGPPPIRFELRLHPALAKKVEKAAVRAKVSMTELIVGHLAQALGHA